MSTVKAVAHTPGPWHVDGLLGPTVYSIEGRQVAMCRPRETVEDSPIAWEVAKSNARLIAAAPELLAALKGLLAPEPDGVYATDDVIQAARAAVKKAEGQ